MISNRAGLARAFINFASPSYMASLNSRPFMFFVSFSTKIISQFNYSIDLLNNQLQIKTNQEKPQFVSAVFYKRTEFFGLIFLLESLHNILLKNSTYFYQDA